jgi:N-acetylmuramoyl-L-alanine amidase
MVVIHYTAMESANAAIERLCDPRAQVSAHYVIDKDGQVTQLVDEKYRAWHAGAGKWGWVEDVNSHSIGFELANAGPNSSGPHFPAAQMSALIHVLSDVIKRHSILPERVIGHSDMAPGRKFDPGPYFDWQVLALNGLSIWPEPEQMDADWTIFRSAAFFFGYRPADDSVSSWETILSAFRLRFRPFVMGQLDGVDVGLMANLAERWPCQAVDLGYVSSID